MENDETLFEEKKRLIKHILTEVVLKTKSSEKNNEYFRFLDLVSKSCHRKSFSLLDDMLLVLSKQLNSSNSKE